MRYVTYSPTGALTGAFWQEVPPEHSLNHIAVTTQQYAQWTTLKANDLRDGLEPAPISPSTPIVPASVTMRQARLALLGAGLLDAVNAAITTAGAAAKIEWEYAKEVQRSSGIVPAMATALGMTDAQIDDLFLTASTL